MSDTRKVEITEQTQQNWMDRTIEQLAPYRRAILGLGLALLVGIFAIALLTRQSEQKQARAWDNYFSVDQITPANEEAARKVITELGTSESALLLKMKLGHFLQREGTQLLFSDKKSGEKKLTEAKEYFAAVAAGSKNSMAVEEALLGVAVSEDSLGDVAAATAAYEKQLQKFPQGVYAKIASDNLERLKSEDSKEWYATFTKADVSSKSMDPFPDFGGKRPGGFPSLENGPSLEGPSSLMPSDPLSPLGSGLTPTGPGFQLPPGLTGGETPAPSTPATGTPAPGSTPATENPLPSLDGKAPATTTPEATTPTPEKSATPDPAKTEPAKTEPAKSEPAKK
jgi:hypothetical protein